MFLTLAVEDQDIGGVARNIQSGALLGGAIPRIALRKNEVSGQSFEAWVVLGSLDQEATGGTSRGIEDVDKDGVMEFLGSLKGIREALPWIFCVRLRRSINRKKEQNHKYCW